VIFVLVGSSLLNAGYFLPILYAAWFKAPADSWPAERSFGRHETVITALLVVAVGLLASTPFSPLHWARFITALEYSP